MVLRRVPTVMLPLCCCPLYFLATNGWGEDVTQLEEVLVTGTPLPAAGSLHLDEPSQVGSRLNVPIKDLPASVEIINQATIQKQGSRTILRPVRLD